MHGYIHALGDFFQVLKDWKVKLGTLGDEFFLFLPKILDQGGLSRTRRDTPKEVNFFGSISVVQKGFGSRRTSLLLCLPCALFVCLIGL